MFISRVQNTETRQTVIAGLQIALKVGGAVRPLAPVQPYHAHRARATSRTRDVEVWRHVSPAANVPVVLGDATTQSHSPVSSWRHNYDATMTTRRVKCLPLAVLYQIYNIIIIIITLL